MDAPNSTVITKESNGNVLIEAEGGSFTLDPTSVLTKQKNSVIVRAPDGTTINEFFVATVEKVVDDAVSPSEVPINDVDTLFSELNNNFFFFDSGSIPSGTLLSKEIIQTLNNGDNVVPHNLGKQVVSFNVLDGNDFVETSGSIIDSNNVNINLAGGGPINNAKIIITYIN